MLYSSSKLSSTSSPYPPPPPLPSHSLLLAWTSSLLVSDDSDHTHSEPFHVYSDLTEVTTVKAKITTNFTDNSLNDFIINLEKIKPLDSCGQKINTLMSFYMLL